MSKLFSSFSLKSLQLNNRIVIAPMCQYSADDGLANDWHRIHLGHLALSGAGLLYVEATAVEAEGRITPYDLGLYSDATEAALAQVLASVRRFSPVPMAIQLAHAGRKGSCQAPWNGGNAIRPEAGGWIPAAPSPLPLVEGDPVPHALDQPGLERIRDAFVASARRALRLGFDMIELHAAHGYLLHEFLSPLANRREDDYGGSLENRLRFPLEVFDAVRAVVPDGVPLGVRVSATDWIDDGWELEQTLAFAHALQARGCDFIHVSSGGLALQQKITLEPGYQVPFAARIRQETGMPTIAVGLITEPEHAEAIIAAGQADMVALARGMLYDPRWPWHAAAKLGARIAVPPQYLRCQPREHKDLFLPPDAK